MHPTDTRVNEYTINGMSPNHFLIVFWSIHGRKTRIARSMKYIIPNIGNNTNPNAILNRFFVMSYSFCAPVNCHGNG
jgi:hypothetical protein